MVNFKKISKNGSITIPAALRRIIGMQTGDGVELRILKNGILVLPAVRHCLICESTENIVVTDGRPLCEDCIKKAAKEMESVDNE